MTGHWLALRAPNIFCMPRKARTPFAETAVFQLSPRDRNPRITMSMILRIPCQRSVVLCVVIRNTWRPVLAISVRSKRRDDVLIYSTPAFTQDTEVTGPVSLELFAKSSAVDTDFTAKLVDVGPDGFAQNLTEGIIRARYRDSQEKANLMNPGQVYKFTH